MLRTATYSVALSVLIGSFLNACSEDSTTEPDPPAETLLAEETIGPSGGSLETQDFVLVVPPGALASPAGLELHDSFDHGFGDEAVSSDFRLEGLPPSFADTLTIRVRHDGSLSGEHFVAVGTDGQTFTDELRSSDGTIYELFEATESAEFLTARLLPEDPAPLSVTSAVVGESRKITATSRYETRTSDHFRIRFPRRQAEFIDVLLSQLEAGHDVTSELGIGFEGRTWEWPVQVLVVDYLRGGRLGSFTPHQRNQAQVIQLRSSALTIARLPEFRPAIVAMMVAIGIATPDDYALTDPNQLWWHSAVILWAAAKYGGPGAPHRPPSLSGTEPLVLTGLPYGFADTSISADYGYSWSAAVDFLTEKDGVEIIAGIYSQIKAGVSPAHALLTRLPDPEYDWWPDFVHQYLTGHYFDIESSLFLSRIEEDNTFFVESERDSTESLWGDHEQLSARLYRVRLNYSGFDEDAALRLQLDTGQLEPEWAVLKVYKAKDGLLTFLADGNDVSIGGIHDLALTGYDVIPVVVNCYTNQPYDEKIRMELQARIVEPVAGFDRCSIEASVIGTFREGTDPPVDELWFPSFYATGAMTDNTFTGELDLDHHPPGVTGSVTVEIDPVSKAILSFRGTGSATGSEGSSTWSVSGSAVPKVEEDPGQHLRYFENGPETCSYVTAMTYVWTPSVGDGKLMTDFWCGDNSEIRVTLSADQ